MQEDRSGAGRRQSQIGQKRTFNMMKTLCPTCHVRGISEMAKRWSTRGWPAKCEQCGALSHALSSTSNGIWVGTLLSVAGLSVAAAVLSIPMPVGLAAVAVLALLINVVMWRRVEMVPITSESAAAAKKVTWFLTAIYALFSLFQ